MQNGQNAKRPDAPGDWYLGWKVSASTPRRQTTLGRPPVAPARSSSSFITALVQSVIMAREWKYLRIPQKRGASTWIP